jgi:hypothetical protein
MSASLPTPAEPRHIYRHVNRMSPKAIDKINRLFESDFTVFGYEYA